MLINMRNTSNKNSIMHLLNIPQASKVKPKCNKLSQLNPITITRLYHNRKRRVVMKKILKKVTKSLTKRKITKK
jgi:hypothetical protein